MLGLTLKIIDDYGAYFQFAHGQHGNAMAQPTGPYRIGSLRYDVVLRADQQGPAGLLPRRGRRPGQLHPGTAGRRGRRGAGHRPGRAAPAQLHPARPVPVQDPDRATSTTAATTRPCSTGRSSSPTSRTGAPSRNGCAPRAATSASGWPRCQERSRLQRQRVVVPLRQPAAGRDQHPGERASSTSTPWAASGSSSGCPLWGNSPETVVSQVVAEEFGIDPSDVVGRRTPTRRAGAMSAGPGGSRRDDHAVRAARGAARTVRDKMIRIAAHAHGDGARRRRVRRRAPSARRARRARR